MILGFGIGVFDVCDIRCLWGLKVEIDMVYYLLLVVICVICFLVNIGKLFFVEIKLVIVYVCGVERRIGRIWKS